MASFEMLLDSIISRVSDGECPVDGFGADSCPFSKDAAGDEVSAVFSAVTL